MVQKAGYGIEMSTNSVKMQERVLANLVLGTVIISLLFLGAMRRLYLSDVPAPSHQPSWLAFGIFFTAGVALVKVNLFRHAVMHLVGIVLAAYFLLVGLVNWYSPDPARVLWVLPILAASYWMPCILQARLASVATLAIQLVVWVKLEFVGQNAIVFGWSVLSIVGIIGFAEYSRWVRRAGVVKLSNVEHGKNLFLATVSHELRTPLHGVSAALDHIKANKDRPDQFEDQLQAAIRSCENATSLVNDLLDHQQLVHDDLTLNPKPQLIKPFIGHVARELSGLAEAKGLKLQHSVSSSLDDEVRVFDERRLRQIIQNLAANAIKYTRSGRVHIDLTEGEKNNELVIRVSDTGSGVPAELQDQLFEPFFRINRGDNRGSGLGLFICRRLAQLMGGNIVLESSSEQGTTFQVTVVLETANMPSPAANEPSKLPDVSGRRVLIADDSSINRIMFKSMLAGSGCEILEAADGVQAIAQVQTQAPDIVFMDIDMPELDGLEATKRLRAEGTGVPIIAQTASLMPEQVQLYLSSGFDDVLGKPFAQPALVQLIATLTEPSSGSQASA